MLSWYPKSYYVVGYTPYSIPLSSTDVSSVGAEAESSDSGCVWAG